MKVFLTDKSTLLFHCSLVMRFDPSFLVLAVETF